MLCQNCGKNEARTHIKRIVNGEAIQLHLCADCAEHLGYLDQFSGFGFNISNFLSDMYGSAQLPAEADTDVCPTCGCTFEDIVSTGMMGCADCYSVFYERLKPSLSRIHGRATHVGSLPAKSRRERVSSDRGREQREARIQTLQRELDKAVSLQEFEQAAKLRDEINALKGGAEQ